MTRGVSLELFLLTGVFPITIFRSVGMEIHNFLQPDVPPRLVEEDAFELKAIGDWQSLRLQQVTAANQLVKSHWDPIQGNPVLCTRGP